MITLSMVGAMSLNCSFILYLVVYLPQLMHNRKPEHLANLSLCLHFVLYTAYLLDLFYGFSNHLQWQYKTVSVVSLFLLMIQHVQITRFATKKSVYWGFLLTTLALITYFFKVSGGAFSTGATLIIGYVSRACFLLYAIPQLIKNRRLQSGQAMSVNFIYLNVVLSLLDMISAWCLNWGWPNKLASPVMVLLMMGLLLQTKKYKYSTKDSSYALFSGDAN